MTPHEQRAEAQARAWLDKHGLIDHDELSDLTKLLLSTEAACLREAKKHYEEITVKRADLYKLLQGGMKELGEIRNEELSAVIVYLEQQAAARRVG